MTIDLREAIAADLTELTAIYNHYVSTTHACFDIEPFTVEQRQDWISHYRPTGPHRLVVAVEQSAVVGYASSTTFRPKPAYSTTVATSVYCTPAAVGRGIGSMLYERLFALIADEDLHRAVAGITLPNEESLRLHRRFGFTDIGIEHEVGRKFGRFWDVLLLERSLPYEPS